MGASATGKPASSAKARRWTLSYALKGWSSRTDFTAATGLVSRTSPRFQAFTPATERNEEHVETGPDLTRQARPLYLAHQKVALL
jgi:hypothetical protein